MGTCVEGRWGDDSTVDSIWMLCCSKRKSCVGAEFEPNECQKCWRYRYGYCGSLMYCCLVVNRDGGGGREPLSMQQLQLGRSFAFALHLAGNFCLLYLDSDDAPIRRDS